MSQIDTTKEGMSSEKARKKNREPQSKIRNIKLFIINLHGKHMLFAMYR